MISLHQLTWFQGPISIFRSILKPQTRVPSTVNMIPAPENVAWLKNYEMLSKTMAIKGRLCL